MKKIFLFANLFIAYGLAAPLILFAESGIVFNSSGGTVSGQLNVSSNVVVVGSMTANTYYGNGSGLTHVPGDNLGNHIATTTFNMGGFGIVNAASGTFTNGITASSATLTNTEGAGLIVSSSVYLAVSGGNAGIGTTAPAAKLNVNGSVLFSGATNPAPVDGELVYNPAVHAYEYYDSDALDWKSLAGGAISVTGGYWTQNGTLLSYITGFVGIGTTNPGSALEVAGQIKITGGGIGENKVLTSDANGLATWQVPALGADNLGNHIATTTLNMGGFGIVNAASGTFTNGITASSATLNNTEGAGLMVSSSAYLAVSGGFVGVGTTNPGAALEVAGQIKITGGGIGENKVLTSDANGLASWQAPGGGSDNLGNHIATTSLNMAAFDITGANHITASSASFTYSVTASSVNTPGLRISSNGELQTTGAGTGSITGIARGAGAVDLQVNRSLDYQVASGQYSTLAGGQMNQAYGVQSVVSGGSENTASGVDSVVGGGIGNNASGDMSMVPGGYKNNATSGYAFAAGRQAHSSAVGAFTWADSESDVDIVTDNNVADRVWFKSRGGFLISGSTNAAMTGMADRGMFVTGDGLVGISTGVPSAALDIVSTGTAANIYAQIWRNGSGVIVSSMTSQGMLYATLPPGSGDNLGNHTATRNLDLAYNDIVGVSTITVSSITAAGAGVTFSTNVFMMNGKVGIGTTNPGVALEVAGQVKITGGGVGVGKVLTSDSAGLATWGTIGGSIPGDNLGNHIATTSLNMANFPVVNVSSMAINGTNVTGANPVFQVIGGTMTVLANGNVGIGITGPSELLTVMKSGTTMLRVGDTDTGGSLVMGQDNSIGPIMQSHTDSSGKSLQNVVGIRMGFGASGYQIYTSPATAIGSARTFTSRLIVEPANGNVGIGTTNPLGLLHVKQTGVNTTAVRIGDQDTITNNTGIYLRTSGFGYVGTQDAGGITRIVSNSVSAGDSGLGISVLPGGNVGIGTTVPGSRLVVAGGGSAIVMSLNHDYSNATTANRGGNIDFTPSADGGTGSLISTNYYGAAAEGRLTLQAYNMTNQLVLHETTGNVGIGTAAPLAKLGVLGNAAIGATYGAITPPTSALIVEGNVGIGTTAPADKLEVSGGNISLYQAAGAGDNIRMGIRSYDSTAMAADVGGQIALGYKYTAAGGYTDGAIIKTYKLNSTDADYSTGLKFQVRNTGMSLSTKMTLDPSGNLGIGTTAPLANLHISSTSASASQYMMKVTTGAAASDAFVITGDGKVGIGTTAPGAALQVAGQVKITGGTPGTGKILTSDTNGLASWQAAPSGADNLGNHIATMTLQMQAFQITGTGALTMSSATLTNTAGAGLMVSSSAYLAVSGGFVGIGTTNPVGLFQVGSVSLAVLNSGFVGVGTTAPGAKLQVQGQVKIVDTTQGAGKVLTSDANGLAAWQTPTPGDNLGSHIATMTLSMANFPIVNVSSMAINGTGITGANPVFQVIGGTLTVLANGSVGIGTTAPDQKLTVAGNISQTGVIISAGTGNNYFAGNIGVGTTNPATGLHVVTNAGADVREQMIKFNTTDAGNDAGYIGNATTSDGHFVTTFAGYQEGSISTPVQLKAMTSAANDAADSSSFGMLDLAALRTDSAADPNNGAITAIANRKLLTVRGGPNPSDIRLTVAAGGNVGIGTTNPGARLQVQGQVKIVDTTQGAGKVLTSDADGLANWQTPGSGADNLGNHTATTNLQMGGFQITGTGALTMSSATLTNTAGAGLMVSSSAYLAVSGGMVGIGTTAPGAALEVAGQVKITGGGAGAGKVLTSDADGMAAWQAPGAGADNLGNHTATTNLQMGGFQITGTGALTMSSATLTNTEGAGLIVSSSAYLAVSGGFVGIGITAPAAKLAVAGSVLFSGATNPAPVDGEFVYDTTTHAYKYYDSGILDWKSLAGGAISVTGGYWTQNGTLLSYNTGFVGIGTTNPGAALEVAGQIKITGGGIGENKVLTSDANGLATWQAPGGGSDNLGNHTATTTLNMAAFNITGANHITASSATFTYSVTASSVNTPGLLILRDGELQTTGAGTGSVAGGARGAGAVDLQVNRSLDYQVASGQYSTLAGGQMNQAYGAHSVVSGGSENTASGVDSVVSGGIGNNASGDMSTVPGGYRNNATENYAFAAGRQAHSHADGAFTWADSEGGVDMAVDNAVTDRVWFKSRGGFLISGSTNAAMTGTANRGMIVTGDGLVGISTGVPRAALDVVSAGTGDNIYAQIWRNGNGVIVSSMTSQGVLYATLSPGGNINAATANISGNLILQPGAVTSVETGATLVVVSAFMKIESALDEAVTLGGDPLISGGLAGQVLVLQGTSDAKTVRLVSSGNVRLNGGIPLTLGDKDTITLIYDGATWVELSRSVN